MKSRTFLGFAEGRPHLQAIDLPDEPRLRTVRADADRADAAFTHIWLRSGWMAIQSHQQLWSLPIPLAGHARLLSEDWDFLPSADPAAMWMPTDGGDRWVTVNGHGSIMGPHIARLPGERLEAVHETSALVRDGAGETLRLRRSGEPDLDVGAGVAVCQAGGTAFVRSHLGATLSALELATGYRSDIARTGFGCWGLFASASPDGTLVAIGCELRPAPRPRPPDVPFRDWLHHPDNSRSDESRNIFVLIDVASLSVRPIQGTFDNFASTPAWSATGDGFVFSIPFENTLAWADRSGTEVRRVRAPKRGRHVLTPLCDATELIGRGID